ncbi:MAG: hypothetical protein D6780_00380, partial [Candidatus Dadabacteria bacterium]
MFQDKHIKAIVQRPEMMAKIEGAESADGVEGLSTEGSKVEVVKERLFRHIEAQKEIYESIAKLPFRVRFGGQTSFDHEKKEVILGVEQLLSLGIVDPREIDFGILHELGHFYELTSDPEGYKSVIKEGKRDDGLGRVYFELYNVLMDIYVNTWLANRADQFR